MAYTDAFNKMEDRDGHRRGLAHSRVTGSHPNSKAMRKFGEEPFIYHSRKSKTKINLEENVSFSIKKT